MGFSRTGGAIRSPSPRRNASQDPQADHGGGDVTIARLHAFRHILLTLLRMVEEDLYARGALREMADPRAYRRDRDV